jgi:hypothetical protein
MDVTHLTVPALIGAITTSAMRHTMSALVAHDRAGRILFANQSFWEQHRTEPQQCVEQVISAELWEVWQAESKIVLDSGLPLHYVAEAGVNDVGQWVTTRCASWGVENVQNCTMMYIEVMPASRRRGIVLRHRVPIAAILRMVPKDVKLHSDTTISQKP